ncbi:MAG: hypothetical protein ABWY55_03270 [Microbacterium sp.]
MTLTPPIFLTTASLSQLGLSQHRIAGLVSAGRLIRLRRGMYAHAGTEPLLLEVGRLGGRLDCVSLLQHLGVFVRESSPLHMQLDPGTTRLPRRPQGVVAHWRPRTVPREALTVDLISALVQAGRCQRPRDTIATLDNALHRSLIDEDDLAEIFRRLPRRRRVLRTLLDARCESGPETIMRLLLRAIGCSFDLQVQIDGVGRVDFVVDGWLIIECDSRAHHEGWEQQKNDRRRDLAAARLGYTTVRPLAEDILYGADELRSALAEIIRHPPTKPSQRNSTDSA